MSRSTKTPKLQSHDNLLSCRRQVTVITNSRVISDIALPLKKEVADSERCCAQESWVDFSLCSILHLLSPWFLPQSRYSSTICGFASRVPLIHCFWITE
jgi:hypothetical protein